MQLKTYFADLHVHLGATSEGKPVKITASRRLTFEAALKEARERKGLDLVGLVDCAAPGVQADLLSLLDRGELEELPGGGLRYKGEVTVLLGVEVETREKKGGLSHHVGWFPYLENLQAFSKRLGGLLTNITLSSQNCGLTAEELAELVLSEGGFLMPAHCFTPHKSLYGACVDSIYEAFSQETVQHIPAIELGLSADSELADLLPELAAFSFLSNSDAHSVAKIAREHNELLLEKPDFTEVVKALAQVEGRKIVANYGLDPKLGKYHRTFCLDCERIATEAPPVLQCPQCGSYKVVTGVLDRLMQLGEPGRQNPDRPPYVHQVPLEFVPGLGPASLTKLLNRFDNEMNVLHKVGYEELASVIGPKLARSVVLARKGKLPLKAGGGGHYGKAEANPAELQLELPLGGPLDEIRRKLK